MDKNKKGSRYEVLKEGYTPGGAMSIYGSLKGLTRRFDPNVQCWCDKASDKKTLPKDGAWYPIQLCESCEATQMKN